MPRIPEIGEAIPKVKASMPNLLKFVLLALGWILGRMVHMAWTKIIDRVDYIRFKSILATTDYVLTSRDIAAFISLAVITAVLYKWGKLLKWLGVGMFLYIVTFEVYEFLWGATITSVDPSAALPSFPSMTASDTVGM